MYIQNPVFPVAFKRTLRQEALRKQAEISVIKAQPRFSGGGVPNWPVPATGLSAVATASLLPLALLLPRANAQAKPHYNYNPDEWQNPTMTGLRANQPDAMAVAKTQEEQQAETSQFDNAKALTKFAKANQFEKFKQKAQEEKVDPSLPDKDGITPLMHVVDLGHLDLAKFLVDQDININIRDPFGETALDHARRKGRTQIVKTLEKAYQKQKDNLSGYVQKDDLVGLDQYIRKHDINPNLAFPGHQDVLDLLNKTKEPTSVMAVLNDNGLRVNRMDEDRRTLLMEVARTDDTELAEWLLERNAHINKADKDGLTALAIASRMGNEPMVKLLVAEGGALDQADTQGMTPLMTLSEQGDETLVDHLLRNNAARNKINQAGDTALGLAVKNKHKGIVRKLLDFRANPNLGENIPLGYTIENGDVETARLLIKNDATGKHAHGKLRDPLMTVLARVEQPEDIKTKFFPMLREAGADMNTVNAEGATPAMVAAGHGELELLNSFIAEKAKLDVRDHRKYNALSYAVQGNHPDCVKSLLKAGMDPNAIDDEKTIFPPLMDAIGKGHTQAAKILLQHGADADYKPSGKTFASPLSLAIKAKHDKEKLVKMVLQHGANPNIRLQDGLTPLGIAADNGDVQMVRLLRNAGADPTMRDKTGWFLGNKLSYYAERHNNRELNELLSITSSELEAQAAELLKSVDRDDLEAAERLLKKGAFVNKVDKDGNFPLKRAVINNNQVMARLLLANMANPNQADPWGNTPLIWAAAKDHGEMGKLLLEANSNPNIANEYGATALTWASQNGNTKFAIDLLDAGADINHATKEGLTPFMLAGNHGHLATAKLLKERGADVCKQDNSGWFVGKTARDWVSGDKPIRDFVEEAQAQRGC